MKSIFDDIIISNPDINHNNPFYTIPLSKAMKKNWFISAVFGSYAWCIKKTRKTVGNNCFKSRSVNIQFNCDREKAEKELEIIAEQKYLMYKELLKGRQ